MTIEAKIICDSVGPNGIRLTTFVLKYPRFIHSEFMTHRAFSRNASSSRAIPFEKQVEMIKEDMAMPLEFRKNQKGMQAGEVIANQEEAIRKWRVAGELAIEQAQYLHELGVHKQYVNRLLEPYSHITVIVTATEYANFFALRHHSAAQPEIAELAKQMWEAYKVNKPKQLGTNEWHLPFVTEEERAKVVGTVDSAEYVTGINELIKISVARCARVSYNNHDGTNTTLEQDLKLYDRLLGQQPIHASPAEHQAQALPITPGIVKWSGNLKGWTQFRQTLKDQNITKFEGPLSV